MFDLAPDKKYLNNLGLSNHERISESLHPEYFTIDEIDIYKFVNFISSYSPYVAYYNEQNKLDGDWSTFFTNDSTLSLLRLSSFNNVELNKCLVSELTHARLSKSESIKSEAVVKVSKDIHSMLISLEKNLVQLSEYHDLQGELTKIVNAQLRKSLSILFEIHSSVLDSKTVNEFRNEYSSYWLASEEDFSINSLNFDESLAVLEELLLSSSRILSKISSIAKNYFDTKVAGSGLIKPHVALLLTFHKLYSKASDEMNRITRKHLDYYYKNILKIELREQKSNEVFVKFILNEGAKEQELLKGEKLTAGVSESGDDILYEVQESSILKEMSLEEVFMVERASRRPILKPLSDNTLENHIFHLGGSKLDEIEKHVNTESAAMVGFSFGCDLLNLEEGYRKITFKFYGETNSFLRFLNELSELKPTDNSKNNWQNNLLKDSFIVSYFGDEQIQIMESSRVEFRIKRNDTGELDECFEIVVLIDIIDPPISFETSDQDIDDRQDYPSFQFVLNPERIELYSAFTRLEMIKVDVEVELLELKNLLLSNDFGPLDPNSPFEPFGSQPCFGASFYIGHSIMFNYSLQDIKLSIEWQGVPGSDGGFEEYYQAYPQIEGNDSFKVKLSSLRDRRWFPSENKQIVDLFQCVNAQESLAISPIRRVNEIDLASMQLNTPISKVNEVTDYSSNVNSGFLKMELCYPLIAFGHEVYPELVRNSSFLAAKSKKEQLHPNEPYMPVMKNITVDFKLSMTYDLSAPSNHNFKHIHPFGFERQSKPNRTLPLYSEGSSLILGFKMISQNKIISTLFQLSDEFSPDKLNGLRFDWSVWDMNNWSKLAPSEILNDGTKGLRKSGIVKLNIERASKDKTGLFNPELLWLKCDSSSGHSFLEGISDVLPNAVLLKCITPQRLKEPNIPAYQIVDLQETKDGVREVIQNSPSFGGRKKEEDTHFYQRVSERLKHKDRAVSIRDYENLLLERFDALYRVKCFANTNSNLELSPGNVLVTVIPFLSASDNGSLILKYFSNLQLREMQKHLEERVSFGVNLNVINPIYEKVRTKFNVKFNTGFDPRFYIKKLNSDIKAYLSPFLSMNEEQLMFGKSIQSTKILSFVDKLEYVDFVLNFSVFHIVNDVIINYNEAGGNSLEINPSTGVSILVSDDDHKISLYDGKNVTDDLGVDDMMIETDFIVEAQDGDDKEFGNLQIGKNYRVQKNISVRTKEISKFALYFNLEE